MKKIDKNGLITITYHETIFDENGYPIGREEQESTISYKPLAAFQDKEVRYEFKQDCIIIPQDKEFKPLRRKK